MAEEAKREHMRQKIRVLAFGLGLGLCLPVGLSATAYADPTCYVGCTPVTPSGGSQPVVASSEGSSQKPSGSASNSGLAFSGADIEGAAAVGGTALLVGGLFVVGGRRLRAAKK